jgi:hypothetical protein
MQIKTLLIACFATGQALGWTIPNGQPDGTYTVHADGNGTLIHEFIVELPTATSATPPQVDIDPDEMDNDVYIRSVPAACTKTS